MLHIVFTVTENDCQNKVIIRYPCILVKRRIFGSQIDNLFQIGIQIEKNRIIALDRAPPDIAKHQSKKQNQINKPDNYM